MITQAVVEYVNPQGKYFSFYTPYTPEKYHTYGSFILELSNLLSSDSRLPRLYFLLLPLHHRSYYHQEYTSSIPSNIILMFDDKDTMEFNVNGFDLKGIMNWINDLYKYVSTKDSNLAKQLDMSFGILSKLTRANISTNELIDIIYKTSVYVTSITSYL